MNRNKFQTTELDSSLLESEFAVDTSWVVITGAPCSGKTTVINELAAAGYETVEEVARKYIESHIRNGTSADDLRADEAKFQRILIDEKVKAEKNADEEKLIFFDRGVPDSITYYRVAGLNPNEALNDCFHYRYGLVLLFDRLTYEDDHVRTEDEETAVFIDEWIERDYRSLGYEVKRVPVLPVKERVKYVIDTVTAGKVL